MKCKPCDGTGKTRCRDCKGEGLGHGIGKCAACDGSGLIRCGACNATGRVGFIQWFKS